MLIFGTHFWSFYSTWCFRKKFDRRGRSQKKFATRLKTSQQYISFILKKYTMIRCFKKNMWSLITVFQKKAERPKCRKLLEQYSRRDFILVEESYLTVSNITLNYGKWSCECLLQVPNKIWAEYFGLGSNFTQWKD